MEITGVAHKLISESFRAIEVFLCAGALYLAINFAVTRAVMLAEMMIAPDLQRPKSLVPAH
jgi:octopine/nopaline transport system permease protein